MQVAPVDSSTTLAELRDLVRRFVEERDSQQFHSPKNLSMSLAIEAADLMEPFHCLAFPQPRPAALVPKNLAAIQEELADVLCYALALANELDIDLASAVRAKMIKNAAKYPADEFRGRYGPEDKSNG